jgi:hypothetical protein
MIDTKPLKKMLLASLNELKELTDPAGSTLAEREEDRQTVMETGQYLYLSGAKEEEITTDKNSLFHAWLMEGFRQRKQAN